MTTMTQTPTDHTAARPPAIRTNRHAPLLRGISVFLILSLVVGGVSGLVWASVAELPSYRINSDGSASMSERGLAQVFSSDSSFCLVGLVTGLLLGLLAWWWFSRRGVLVVPIAAVGALMACLTCWWIGILVGPSGFAIRISGAKAGDLVPIDLALRSWPPVLVWPFAALVPVLVISMVRWDAAERSRQDRPRRRRRPPSAEPARSARGGTDSSAGLSPDH